MEIIACIFQANETQAHTHTHTHTHGRRIYIFGGYGGERQRRQFFNDVHVLDLDLNAWLGQANGFEALRDSGLKTVC